MQPATQDIVYFGLRDTEVPLPLGWMLSAAAAKTMQDQLHLDDGVVAQRNGHERGAEESADSNGLALRISNERSLGDRSGHPRANLPSVTTARTPVCLAGPALHCFFLSWHRKGR